MTSPTQRPTDDHREPALLLREIDAGYGKKLILRGLTLAVESGEILGLIGTNGAGKSTLLKVAVGLLAPSSGSVWVEGSEVTHQPTHRRVRSGLGYLIQGGQVFPTLTVAENLAMGALPLPPAERAGAIERVLELLDSLRPHTHRRAGLLSGGQRQFLALGIVLVQEPRLVLLDEPSAGLAPKVAIEVLAKIRKLNEAAGTTVLVVEQRVREALGLVHRAVVLHGGTVAAESRRPEDWLAEGSLDPFFFGAAADNNATARVA